MPQSNPMPIMWQVELMTLDELINTLDPWLGIRRLMNLAKLSPEVLAHAFHEHRNGNTLEVKEAVLPFVTDNDLMGLTWAREVIAGEPFILDHLDELQVFLTGMVCHIYLVSEEAEVLAAVLEGYIRQFNEIQRLASFIGEYPIDG